MVFSKKLFKYFQKTYVGTLFDLICTQLICKFFKLVYGM